MKAGQGCWTCKKRKIGCDRGVPTCNNCTRTGRQCLGYGIRLVWPDRPDGRRRMPNLPAPPANQLQRASGVHYGRQFLNITWEDLSLSRLEEVPPVNVSLLSSTALTRPARAFGVNPDLQGHGSQLLAYYEDRLSRMISTVDAESGFRLELLPMALSASDAAAAGLLNAMLSVSAFHTSGSDVALPYKANAHRLLSASLAQESSSLATIHAQIATSMMLCVYNVFDESEGNWHLHIGGARNLVRRAAALRGGRLDCSFLYTWFLYHEVLGAFSQPPRRHKESVLSLELLQESDFDRVAIVGSLGCSVEVMEIIHHINELRSDRTRDKKGRDNTSETESDGHSPVDLRRRLLDLTQKLDTADFEHHTPKERTKILTTAELYRVAALLYLGRTCASIRKPGEASVYLEQAFDLLGSLEVCTSPWPLFVIACEAESDEQRITILRTLDCMDEARKIGNVFVLRSLIETYWKQKDLQADSDRPKDIKWWELINFENAAPWFI